ncbi:cysteine synthase family protein [Actinopolyspora mortivallis]|uniref:Cysteine synthase family protein n=1 Tax=Actinopolyspora mortivallis TaxID=33906 RepID=A0A2T0GSU3_ACTMO|nr:cysteine synthase family protein [Actinopolyspora mortivallis]
MSGVLDLVGNSPLISLSDVVVSGGPELVAKWERFNPAGSIKDRPALHLVETAEQMGLLSPGGTIIESSSGNFGISLAMIAAVKGYRAIILVDPKTTDANRAALEAFGAEVIVVHEQDDTGSYHKTRIKLANELAREIPGSFRPDQCFNLLNAAAHYRGTASEILAQFDDSLSAVVTTVSTGGQLGGISRRLRGENREIEIIAADAVGSGIFQPDPAAYATPGVGLGWTPSSVETSLVDRVLWVPDELAFIGCRMLARHEGLLTGASSGMALVAALRLASELPPDRKVCVLFSDGGDRYLNTVYSDEWLKKCGLATELRMDEFLRRCGELQWHLDPCRQGPSMDEFQRTLDVPESTSLMSSTAFEDGE